MRPLRVGVIGSGDAVPTEAGLARAVGAALARATELCPAGTVVVTGSCHTVGDVLLMMGLSPFSADRDCQPTLPH